MLEPNVFVTRLHHPWIADAAQLGTSIGVALHPWHRRDLSALPAALRCANSRASRNAAPHRSGRG